MSEQTPIQSTPDEVKARRERGLGIDHLTRAERQLKTQYERAYKLEMEALLRVRAEYF